MIRSEPLTRHAAFRDSAERLQGRRGGPRTPAGLWAPLVDDRRAIRFKIIFLMATAAVAAALEVPWR